MSGASFIPERIVQTVLRLTEGIEKEKIKNGGNEDR